MKLCALCLAALLCALPLSACTRPVEETPSAPLRAEETEDLFPPTIPEELPPTEPPSEFPPSELPSSELPPAEIPDPTEPPPIDPTEEETSPPVDQTTEVPDPPTEPTEPQPPKKETAEHLLVTADRVNLRSGAGTQYAVIGTADKNSLYAFLGETGDWYQTAYRNRRAYLHKDYARPVGFLQGSPLTEEVIAEGFKYLGTPYVYGATRLHDGQGNLNRGFTDKEFDCSSLMQFLFYGRADTLLGVTTRTQVLQGETVAVDELRRGDLLFFTNASRKNKTGIERVGHVALYLGENYILHTASDYARAEELTSLRWSYFLVAKRII